MCQLEGISSDPGGSRISITGEGKRAAGSKRYARRDFDQLDEDGIEGA
jgi:hypothetical protein